MLLFGRIPIFYSIVIIENHVFTRGCANGENISVITREPNIGILPKPTTILCCWFCCLSGFLSFVIDILFIK